MRVHCSCTCVSSSLEASICRVSAEPRNSGYVFYPLCVSEAQVLHTAGFSRRFFRYLCLSLLKAAACCVTNAFHENELELTASCVRLCHIVMRATTIIRGEVVIPSVITTVTARRGAFRPLHRDSTANHSNHKPSMCASVQQRQASAARL